MSHLHGIHVPHRKNTAESAPVRMPSPKTAFYPVTQHIGAPAKPVVKAGDEVFVGTMIAEAGGFVSSPIYSGVSGKVKKIDSTLQAGGAFVPTVVIESDGLGTPDPSIAPPEVSDFDSFIEAVRNSGVVGLGGAGFPTAVKLGVKDLSKIEYVVINGAECEPYLTGDTRTMIDRADDMAEGIELIRKYLGVKRFIIGIEKNKPQCIAKMRELCSEHEGVSVMPLPSVYPQGGEKVLIYHTTGRVVKEGKLPMDAGVIVINVTTLAAIASYIRTGMPLVEKCITVDGSAVKEPKNVIAPIGTPVCDVFEFAGGFSQEPAKVLYGGPMMGISVADMNAPVLKQTNGLIALNEKDARPPKITNCIRCGRCTNTCPFGLAPVAIAAALNEDNMEELYRQRANLCMECGCCSFVCPAKRPLVQQNKLAKAKLMPWLKEQAAKKEEKK
ncbi:MAG: electron transport complex subunit RsxC [Clostridia bacterium]|nr:electron transport complex subunit RsxC [Clostridia bacterium]